jgi:hypothetical protein
VEIAHARQHITALRHASLPFVTFADPRPTGLKKLA